MSHRFRRVMVCLSAALLFWQVALAPLAHAASHPPLALAIHEAVAHETMAHETTEEMGAAPCHGVTEAGQLSPDLHAGHVSADPDAPGADCCQSPGCGCACVHASVLAVVASSSLPLIPEAPAVVMSAAPVQSIRVAELFRPPI